MAPDAPKSGPRTLSAAELATLRQRIQNDKARRAQALDREQAAAEEQRRQMEQAQQMAALEEEYWEEESAAPAPDLAAVFLNTLSSEMAHHQAQREAQDAFIRDVQHQQRMAVERRQREEERQRREAERARQQQYAQPSSSGPSPAATAQEAARQASQAQAAEARDRELAAQAAAERARRQQLRVQQPAATPATPATPGPAAPAAAAQPLRFILTISLLNKPGDTVNPTCYSNVITRPGPPGWGAPGFLPAGSGDQAQAVVHSLKNAFIARCRASGREITSEGNFNYVWNRSKGEEELMQGTRPRFREDVAVSL